MMLHDSDCFENPKNIRTKIKLPKTILAKIFLPKKIPKSKIANPISLDHPCHLKSRVPPPPPGGRGQS